MLTPPTTSPNWATSGSAEVDTPAPVVRAIGWTSKIPPAVGWMNWWFRLVAEWITYLSGRTTLYATLEEAVEGTEPGDVVMVDEQPAGTEDDPVDYDIGTAIWTRTKTQNGSQSGRDIATDGRYVYLVRDATVVVLDRATGATVVRTDTLTTSSPTPSRLVCDGVYYALAIGNKVEIRKATDGTLVVVVDHGATVHDVCLVNQAICVLVGGNGTGNVQARGIDITGDVIGGGASPGDQIWQRQHGTSKVLYACAGWGRKVVVAGESAGTGDNPTIRCLNVLTGNDDTTDGGSTPDGNFLGWHSDAVSVSAGGVLAVDESAVYVGEDASSMQRLGLDDGAVVDNWSLPGDVSRLTVDHRCVYIACTSGGSNAIIAMDKRTGARAWRTEIPSATGTGVASDGTGLFMSQVVSTGAESAARRLYIPAQPGLWRRVDPTYNRSLVYRRLIVPAEE